MILTAMPPRNEGAEFFAHTGEQMKHYKTITVAATGVLIGLLLAVILALIGFGGFSGMRATLKYAAVMRVIRTQFIGEYDLDDVTDAALVGAIDSLDDNWSYYMNAEAYEDYLDLSSNRYQGIGVTIQKDEQTGGFLIVSVNKDGPAHTAGITAGDIIVAVDGTDVTGEDGDTTFLRGLIQADYGKTALVTVLHEDGTEESYSVSCEEIYTSPVSYEMLDGNVGYIIITNFRQGSGADAIEAIEALVDSGAKSLVFDVRSNPGGQVTELIELLDYLLPEGDIFIRADKQGHETVEKSDDNCLSMPVAVIVNGDSYSAAEYFAAALREYDWAVIVGDPTTGKARSQVNILLTDGSAVHLSKYTYLTPERQDLYEAGGLVPDVEITLAEEEQTLFNTGWLEPEDDPQVIAAVAALNA